MDMTDVFVVFFFPFYVGFFPFSFFLWGYPKKVCILSRSLNPFSTRETTGKDIESFLLASCVCVRGEGGDQ